MKAFSSLQARLLALLLGLVLLAWTGVGVVAWRGAGHELDELLDGHLAQAAALLIAQQSPELDLDDDDGVLDGPLLHAHAPRVVFQVWHEGRLVMRSANAPTISMKPRTPGFDTLAVDGADWRVFAARGAESDIEVVVGERLGAREAILRAVLRSLVLPMLVALPLLALAGWSAVRLGLTPLRALGSELERRHPQALQPVDAADAPAEMRPLFAALNGLFGRVTTLIESERRFTADAAHELRTPIAAIRSQAQVALGSSNAAEQQHALRATLEGCDRAARLVDQLLTLSRLESGAPAPVGTTDLGAVCRQVIAALAPRALDKQQQLGLQAPGRYEIQGNETLIAALLRNLVDNAVRYSPRAARIDVVLAADRDGVQLCVEDSGPGLDDEQLARLGDRFFRVPGNDAPGSGLGWSIVRRIAATQGARVAVDRSPALGGLRVRINWAAVIDTAADSGLRAVKAAAGAGA
jgi:two-component system sensor histidine kinase QseC